MEMFIHGGCVRLLRNRVQYWDGDLCAWRPGWGAYATVAALGHDERVLARWRERARAGSPRSTRVSCDEHDTRVERRHM